MTLRAAAAALAFSVLAVGLLTGARAYLTTMQAVVSPSDQAVGRVAAAR